jgi:S-adenosylmethionine:tRNA ribosyltransferase-isomerase
VLTREFDFPLPPELIAQHPSPERDRSRLLVVHRGDGQIEHRQFPALAEYLRAGDVLVLNDSRVIPARLRGRKDDTGGAIEILLLEENAPADWWVMLRPGKRVRPGTRLSFVAPDSAPSPLRAEVTAKNDEGWCRLKFSGVNDLRATFAALGEMPLPPYIARDQPAVGAEDRTRYQTVYAARDGSVAAPTAGLHFTPELLERLRAAGVSVHFVTLHVGHGTFAPVKVDDIAGHVMHEERFEVPATTADAVNRAKAEGRRVVAVGTTSVRVLESVARAHAGRLVAGPGRTRIFLHPPTTFGVVDALLTNFHLPQSTLLMLVSAFAAPGEHPRGRDLALRAYAEAVRERYRFFSYGDAMLLI